VSKDRYEGEPREPNAFENFTKANVSKSDESICTVTLMIGFHGVADKANCLRVAQELTKLERIVSVLASSKKGDGAVPVGPMSRHSAEAVKAGVTTGTYFGVPQ